MTITAEQIAAYTGGTVEGDANAQVTSFAKIEEGVPGALSFLANPKYEHFIYETRSSVVLVGRDFVPAAPVAATLIRVDNAYECVARLLQLYESLQQRPVGIHPTAAIDPTATVGQDCYIGAYAVVEAGAVVGDKVVIHPHVTVGRAARVGDETTIYAGAVIYHDCQVGKRCVLHAGCVVGADGFGFAPAKDGYEKIPQIGIVRIEDDVEIGANTCIDRSTMGATVVHHGVKLDNLVQIAHNVQVGANTVMSAQNGVAGSTKIGEWCMFGGQVGVSGHIEVGDHTHVGAQSGIMGGNVARKGHVELMGYPAVRHRDFTHQTAYVHRLPQMSAELDALRKEVDELKAQLAAK